MEDLQPRAQVSRPRPLPGLLSGLAAEEALAVLSAVRERVEIFFWSKALPERVPV